MQQQHKIPQTDRKTEVKKQMHQKQNKEKPEHNKMA